MKRHIKVLTAGIVIPSVLLGSVLASFAQTTPTQTVPQPSSIYNLNGGNLQDSVGDGTPAATIKKNDDSDYIGSTPLTQGRDGSVDGAIAFDGTFYIQTKEPSDTWQRTFSVWFRADDVTDERSIVDSDIAGRFGQSLIIGYGGTNEPVPDPKYGDTGDGTLDIQYNDGFKETEIPIVAGKWYNAFVSYTETTLTLYLTGNNQTIERTFTVPKGTLDVGDPGAFFRFGRHNKGDPQEFIGAIDEVTFYDRALTPEEISLITNTTPVPFTPAPVPPTPFVAPTPTAVPPTAVPPTAVPPTAVPQPQPSNATAWGDVHFITFDGVKYDYQGIGEFLVTRSTPGGVLIQSRQEAWATKPNVSVNTAIAMMVGTDKVEVYLYPTLSMQVNDVATAFPTGSNTLALPNGGTIKRTTDPKGTAYLATWPDKGTAAKFVTRPTIIDLYLTTANRALTYEGLLGNFDGERKNDLRARDGTIVAPTAAQSRLDAFGESWRLMPGESLLDPENAQQAAHASSVKATVSLSTEEAKKACADGGVSDPVALDACIFDVAATGDLVFVDSGLSTQESLRQNPAVEIVPVVISQEVFLPFVQR